MKAVKANDHISLDAALVQAPDGWFLGRQQCYKEKLCKSVESKEVAQQLWHHISNDVDEKSAANWMTKGFIDENEYLNNHSSEMVIYCRYMYSQGSMVELLCLQIQHLS